MILNLVQSIVWAIGKILDLIFDTILSYFWWGLSYAFGEMLEYNVVSSDMVIVCNKLLVAADYFIPIDLCIDFLVSYILVFIAAKSFRVVVKMLEIVF